MRPKISFPFGNSGINWYTQKPNKIGNYTIFAYNCLCIKTLLIEPLSPQKIRDKLLIEVAYLGFALETLGDFFALGICG